MQKRRFEILLPLQHNDGSAVDGEFFEQTREELVAQFGAVSFSPEPVKGIWVHESTRYEDNLLRLTVDVDDLAESSKFFLSFKEVLKERFQQIEIYVASYPVDIL